jgi:hypothetical protein
MRFDFISKRIFLLANLNLLLQFIHVFCQGFYEFRDRPFDHHRHHGVEFAIKK